jgi:hypothetical protein
MRIYLAYKDCLFFSLFLSLSHTYYTIMTNEIHIPYLSEDEKIFLNTTATYSQVRRMSNAMEPMSARPSMEDNSHQRNNRRHQVVSVSSLSFLWKRRGSSSSAVSSSAGSVDCCVSPSHSMDEEHPYPPQSPKARELESLIFEQPQRTVRLSITPRCAV